MDEIETFNKFFVGATSNGIRLMRPPTGELSHDDALNLAAWLVAVADPGGERFAEVLAAVEST